VPAGAYVVQLRRREEQLADQRRTLQHELAAIIADPLGAGWNEPEAAELDGRIGAISPRRGAGSRRSSALAEQLHIARNCESPSAGTLMNAEQRTTYDKMMAAANRVAQLLWRCDQAERERLLEQAFDDVAEVSRVSGADLDVCRLAVAVQLERLDEGAGHA
jgi:hypothetical protein